MSRTTTAWQHGLVHVLRRRLVLNVVSTALFVAILYFFFKKFDIVNVWSHVRAQQNAWVLIPMGLSALAYVGHGLRFRALVGARFPAAWFIVNFGAVANSALPFRLGDITRLYVARSYFGVESVRIIATTIVEKVLDLSAVLLFVGSAVLLGYSRVLPGQYAVLGGCLALFACAVLLAVQFRHTYHDIPRSGAIGIALRLLDAFIAALPFHKTVEICAFTVAIWGLNLAATYLSFRFTLGAVDVTILDSLVLTVVTSLAIAVPGAPAGLGIFEAGVIAYLVQVHRVDPEMALASALIFRGVLILPAVLATVTGGIKMLASSNVKL